MDQMEDLENCFSIKIIIYSLHKNGTVSLMFNSLKSSYDKMYLNLSRNHLSCPSINLVLCNLSSAHLQSIYSMM